MKKSKKRNIILNELKGKIRAENYSLRTLSPLVNIAPNTLCLKINGISDFTSTEIFKLCEVLNIEHKDICKYFFPQMLPKETFNNKKVI